MDIYLAALVQAQRNAPAAPLWTRDEEAYFAGATRQTPEFIAAAIPLAKWLRRIITIAADAIPALGAARTN